ncbi:Carbamoyl-phosphate synthase small chain, chloroplastic [Glycine soja]|uniref:Carbamoyl-phosphate synthase small chain, chloroplastic n=1 Tax=Glycine soja TaxID=3848 RepID=A0A445GG38_GLYSO|nr:Carbamoyl-phosphate synthase small chain, chloroplastic [Glycine soja]
MALLVNNANGSANGLLGKAKKLISILTMGLCEMAGHENIPVAQGSHEPLKAIKRDSSFASKVKRIVILGGAFFALGNVNLTTEANNHNYAVDPATLPEGVEVTHRNLNDGSCAGLAFPAQRIMSLQYHLRHPQDPMILIAVNYVVNNVIELELQGGPKHVKYAVVGGLSDQIRQLRESIELPLTNPEFFLRVGIGMKLPKVWMF